MFVTEFLIIKTYYRPSPRCYQSKPICLFKIHKYIHKTNPYFNHRLIGKFELKHKDSEKI